MQAIEYYCITVPAFIYGYFWVPAPLRRLYWYLSPQGFKIRACKAKLKAFVAPKIRQVIKTWQEEGQVSGSYTLLGAMLELKAQRGQIKQDPKAMTNAELERQVDIFSDEMIFTGFDSAGPVACMVTQLVFEAMRDKDLTRALRDEIEAALAANNGEWNTQVLTSVPKLDSFTRESLRVNGPTLCKDPPRVASCPLFMPWTNKVKFSVGLTDSHGAHGTEVRPPTQARQHHLECILAHPQRRRSLQAGS